MRRDQARTPARVIGPDFLGGAVTTTAVSAMAPAASLGLHTKLHKSAEIARRLAATGGLGGACAAICETVGLATAGAGGILIASPAAIANQMCGTTATLSARKTGEWRQGRTTRRSSSTALEGDPNAQASLSGSSRSAD